MGDIIGFSDRDEFRKWLNDHYLTSGGVWLLFGKAGGPKTIKAGEALEEALCFGWIDGQMQSIDDKTYKKYFSMRREKSKWSEKNKKLVQDLAGLYKDNEKAHAALDEQYGEGTADFFVQAVEEFYK